jgi:hypothetical protein
LQHIVGQLHELIAGNIPQPIGNLLHTDDFKAPPIPNGLHVTGGLLQGFMGAGIQPGIPSAQQLHFESPATQIFQINIGDFKFSAGGRLIVIYSKF